MRRNIDSDLLLTNFEPLTVQQLQQRVKSSFVGEPTKISPRRTEMQNLGALATAKIPLQELLPLGEPQVNSQLAVVFFPQIEELGQQFDAQVQKDNLTPAEVAQIVSAVSTEQHFRIPERLLPLASLIFAMLLLLTTVATACAADNPAASQVDQFPPQPVLFIDTTATQPPVLGGGEGEPPAPVEAATEQICVFDSARNLRTGPSATAAKTTLDGSGTTVAGKEYQCFEKVENSDKSVWVRIGEEPEVWAVLVHPTLRLTGTIQPEPTVNESTLAESQASIASEYNRIAPELGLESAKTVIQSVDNSTLYINENSEAVAVSRLVKDPISNKDVLQLFSIDATGAIAESPVAQYSDGGWIIAELTDATKDIADAAQIDASVDVTTTDTIGPTITVESPTATFITEALQPRSLEQENMNALLPENFAQMLEERGVNSIIYDEASSLYKIVDKNNKEYYFVPQAASCAEGDGLADFEGGFFMGTADSWMHLKAGQAALNVLFLVDHSDKVLDGPLTLVDQLTDGRESELATEVLKILGMDPEVKKEITLVIAQSGTELTTLTPPDQREGELPNVLKSNDSRRRVFVVGADKYVSIGYMLRAGTTDGETYINLLKNYIAQGAPDEYIVNAILLTRYISRHFTLFFDTLSGTGIPSDPNDLLEPLRTLIRDGQDGYKAAATAALKPRSEIAAWLK